MKMKKKDAPKYMVGGEMKKMPGGGKMPMYMYGGKVFAEGGKMLDGILDDPVQAKRAAAHPNVKKQMGAK
jgi:predicted nucleic acid-binding Zn ribbon protein